MSYCKINNVLTLTSGQSGSLKNAFGILPASGATGTLTLERNIGIATGSYTTINIAHLTPGIPFHCFVTNVSVTAGTVYVLG